MFWTAFIWGLGGSLGVAFGMMAFTLMHMALEYMTGKAAEKAEGYGITKETLEAFHSQNRLTGEQLVALDRIAAAIEVQVNQQAAHDGEA